MSKRKITVKIENNKIIFSNEILDYFNNLRTNENSEWIDKYFEVLGDENNFCATKYQHHHIIPCFTFKDETHKNREETESLANKIEENITKLSIKNHIMCHFYIWKIFNNRDSKIAFQKMCGQERYINNLTENELKEIAKLKEECAKENLTNEDLKKLIYEWSKTEKGKESIAKSQKKYGESEHGKQTRKNYAESERGKEALAKGLANYRNSGKCRIYYNEWSHSEKGKESIAKSRRKRIESGKSKEYQSKWRKTENGKESIKKSQAKYRNSEKGKETRKIYEHSDSRKEMNKKYMLKYRNSEKGKETIKRYIQSERGKEVQAKAQAKYKNTEKGKETRKKGCERYRHQPCYDPIKNNYCTLDTLRGRKRRHEELYKDVILLNCVIKNNN